MDGAGVQEYYEWVLIDLHLHLNKNFEYPLDIRWSQTTFALLPQLAKLIQCIITKQRWWRRMVKVFEEEDDSEMTSVYWLLVVVKQCTKQCLDSVMPLAVNFLCAKLVSRATNRARDSFVMDKMSSLWGILFEPKFLFILSNFNLTPNLILNVMI